MWVQTDDVFGKTGNTICLTSHLDKYWEISKYTILDIKRCKHLTDSQNLS